MNLRNKGFKIKTKLSTGYTTSFLTFRRGDIFRTSKLTFKILEILILVVLEASLRTTSLLRPLSKVRVDTGLLFVYHDNVSFA